MLQKVDERFIMETSSELVVYLRAECLPEEEAAI